MLDNALNIEHRDRIDAGEGLVEQDEQGGCSQGSCDLDATALAARQADAEALADMPDVQLVQQIFKAIVETLSDWASQTKDTAVLTEYVRNALRRTISAQYAELEADGAMLEEAVLAALRHRAARNRQPSLRPAFQYKRLRPQK